MPSPTNKTDALSYELSDNDVEFLLKQAKAGVVAADDLADVSDASGIRTLDGFGNNVENPLWGNADQTFKRLSEANFENGVDEPRDGPLPRKISNLILNQNKDGATNLFGPNAGDQDLNLENNFRANEFVWAFGQYFDHGLDFIPKGGVNGDGTAAGTMFLGDFETPNGDLPLTLTRATPADGTGINGVPREYINQTSPFIDQNQAYGSNDKILEFLLERDDTGQFTGRLLSGAKTDIPTLGEAKANWQKGVDAGLAEAIDFDDPAAISNFRGSGDALLLDINPQIPLDDHLVAGDGRVNENAGLSVVHTIWHNNHNFWVEKLAKHFFEKGAPSDLSSEHLFQMAKIINEAEYQRAVADEFIELLVGTDVHAFLDYNPEINADITLEFSQAAYRLGHSMLNNHITVRTDADGTTKDVPLFDLFLNPIKFTELGADDIASGMFTSLQQEIDAQLVTTVRNNLLGRPLDLASLNIGRGRDVGGPTLNEMRESVGLSKYSDWDSFASNLRDPSQIEDFKKAYSTIDEVDLWVGGLAEKPSASDGFGTELAQNSVMGETFAQVFSTQMIALQDGDRFYYKHRLFQTELLANIQNQDFADIIERTLDLEYLQADIFKKMDNRFDFSDVDEAQKELVGAGKFEVENGSFEETVLKDGKHVYSIEGWNIDKGGKTAGTFNPKSSQIDEATLTGANMAFINAKASISKTFEETYHAGAVYSFQADIGDRTDYKGDFPFSLVIYAGDKEIGRTDATTGDINGLKTVAVTSVAQTDPALVGKPIKLVIENGSGKQLAVDNVVASIGDTGSSKEGHDIIIGRDIAETIFGKGGDDTIFAKGGDDTVKGGDGDDAMHGGDGDDKLIGGDGDDRADGGKGKDHIEGGIGDDDLSGNEGDDYVDGGLNDDEAFGGAGNDHVRGGSGDDELWGGLDDDKVDGGTGNDIINGNDGNDIMIGGYGHDRVVGGEGKDSLTGGLGRDEFWFLPESGQDVITDFEIGKDKVDLHRYVWEFGEKAILTALHAMTDKPGGAVLTLPEGSTITFDGVAKADLLANKHHFILEDRVFARDNLILDDETNIVIDAGKSDDPTKKLLVEHFNVGTAIKSLDDVDFNADPAFVEEVEEVNYKAGKNGFYDGGPEDYFAARMTGNFKAEKAGEYTFHLKSDDGSQLIINEELVVDHDGVHDAKTKKATVMLEAGVHDIEVKYFENEGDASIDLDWEGPGFKKTQMKFVDEVKVEDPDPEPVPDPDPKPDPDPDPAENLVKDNPHKTQHLDGKGDKDVFVIDGKASEYAWADTEDGEGIVIWNDKGFDVLHGFETVRFEDKDIDLTDNGGGGDPGGDGEFKDDPDQTQHLDGKGDDDVFIIDAASTGYTWTKTDDGEGIVIWNDTGFDVLHGFEKIRFTDKEIDLTGNGGGDPDTGLVVDDIKGQVQYLDGTKHVDRFVVDGKSADHGWGLTEDKQGYVVWGDDGHDVLYDFEEVQFTDKVVELPEIA